MTPKVSDVKLALHCPVSSSDEAGAAVRDSSSFAIIEGSEQATRDGDWKPLKKFSSMRIGFDKMLVTH